MSFFWNGVITQRGAATPPVGCTIALTGDIGPAAGFAAADIFGGNYFSVTDAGANVYLASTPFATAEVRRPMPAEGKKVWIQADSFYTDGPFGTNARVGFYVFSGDGNPIALGYVRGGTVDDESVVGTVAIETPGGVFLADTPLPWGFVPYISFGIDSDGELYIYRPFVGEVALSSLDEDFAGALAGATTLILFGLCDLSGGGPGSAGARIITNQNEMLDKDFLFDGEDWCGNALPVWTPNALGDKLVAWYEADPSTLFTTSSGDTPVTADGDPVGLVLDRSGNGNHLIQTAATSRPIYRTDGTRRWLEFDGVDDWLYLETANYLFVNNGSFTLGIKDRTATTTTRAYLGGRTNGYIGSNGTNRNLLINNGGLQSSVDTPSTVPFNNRKAFRINKSAGTLSVKKYGDETEYTNSTSGGAIGLNPMQAVGAFGFDGGTQSRIDLFSLVITDSALSDGETNKALAYTENVIGGSE
jgi:hypothetical protein